jgi:hypothetical protein
MSSSIANGVYNGRDYTWIHLKTPAGTVTFSLQSPNHYLTHINLDDFPCELNHNPAVFKLLEEMASSGQTRENRLSLWLFKDKKYQLVKLDEIFKSANLEPPWFYTDYGKKIQFIRSSS